MQGPGGSHGPLAGVFDGAAASFEGGSDLGGLAGGEVVEYGSDGVEVVAGVAEELDDLEPLKLFVVVVAAACAVAGGL